MIKVYGLGLSFPVNRVRMCCNAIGVDHEFVVINPLAGETQTEEYLRMNPSGKIPAIDDDGFYLFESNAIMKYLCRKNNSDLYPAEIIDQAHVDKWLDFIGAHLNNGLAKVFFIKLLPGLLMLMLMKNLCKKAIASLNDLWLLLRVNWAPPPILLAIK